PGGPVRDEIRVGEQNARRIGMSLKDADRLARLDEQSLIAFEPAENFDDLVEAFPVSRRPPDAAVNDQVARPLCDFGVEVVHEHAQGSFCLPALAGPVGAARGAYFSRWIAAGEHRLVLS